MSLSLEDLMNIKVATVTTASKEPEKATDAPATAVVVTAQDIQNRGYHNLKDVLRDLPGMETTEYYYSEIGTQVAVRGISGNNLVVVLVNGMRVNPPGGEYFPFRSDFSVRDAEQVEVIYGPGSTLYGQDAISAVINVKTKKPVEGQLGEIGVDGGAYGERDAWFSLGKTFGPNHEISLTGYFQYHDSSLTHIDQDYPAWWSAYHDVALAAKPAGLGLTPYREDYGLNGFVRLEGDNWSVQYWHRESQRSSGEGRSTGLPFEPSHNPPQQPGLYFLKQGVWGDESDVVEARLAVPISQTLKLESALTFNHYQIEPDTRYIEAFISPSPTGPLTNWNFKDFKFGHGTGVDLEETLRWQIAPKFSMLTGVYAGYFDITPKSTVPQPSGINSADYVYFLNGKQFRIPIVGHEDYETYAGYVELNWQLTPKLKAIAGTRVTGDTRITNVPVTPRASLIYDVTDKLTAKYIFTRAYVAPAPYFAFATYDNGVDLATINKNLQSETAVSNEVNFSYAEKNRSLGLSLYYGEQSNLIIPSQQAGPGNVVDQTIQLVTAPNGALRRRTLVETINAGRSRNVGFDLYGRETIGQVSPWFSYSYVDFQQTVEGQSSGLPGISRHNGRLGVTLAVTPRLFITPSLVIRSTPENIRNPGVLGHQLDTPYQFNLAAQYNISRNMRAFAEIENITNHKYALGDISGSAYPQETIHGVVGLQIDF